jgi:hypothetical protein
MAMCPFFTETVEHVLEQCRCAGITLYVENGTLRFKATQGKLTEELRQTIRSHKATLLSLLQSEAERQTSFCHAIQHNELTAPVPSDKGKALLQPFVPVIKAAHRNQLPIVALPWARTGELNAYTCAIAAGIWYGDTLPDKERLSAHLENLRRLQFWFDEQPA